MKKVVSGLMLFVALLWAGVSFACSTCGCQVVKADHAHDDPAAEAKTEVVSAAAPVAAVAAVSAGNKICPVMGTPVSEDSPNKVEYEGKTYNLCCPACKEAFLKDPQAALQKLAEAEAVAAQAVSQ